MDESLHFNGSGLFFGYDFSSEALGFFRAAGHTTASEPLIVANDILHCIYSELKFTAYYNGGERLAFQQIDSLSHLFTLGGDVFHNAQSTAVRYYAVSLNTSKSDRTTTANVILNAFVKNAKDFFVLLFRHEEMCMLAFAMRTYFCIAYFSKWFDEADVDEFIRKADSGNISFDNGCELFSDFVYMTARSYYVHPLSRDYIHAEWYLLDEDERPSWNDYAIARMSENSMKYGDDYIDVIITKDYQVDNIDSKDFEFDLLTLELELARMEESNAFELDKLGCDDFEDDEEYDSERIKIEDIPVEIVDDPVKLLEWLRKNELAVNVGDDENDEYW